MHKSTFYRVAINSLGISVTSFTTGSGHWCTVLPFKDDSSDPYIFSTRSISYVVTVHLGDLLEICKRGTTQHRQWFTGLLGLKNLTVYEQTLAIFHFGKTKISSILSLSNHTSDSCEPWICGLSRICFTWMVWFLEQVLLFGCKGIDRPSFSPKASLWAMLLMSTALPIVLCCMISPSVCDTVMSLRFLNLVFSYSDLRLLFSEYWQGFSCSLSW